DSRQIVGVPIHVIPGPRLAGPAMATAIVCNHAESILGEEKQLSVPGIGIQRPSVRKRDDRAFAPVFVVDCRAIFYHNRAHVNFLLKCVRAEPLAVSCFSWRAPAPERLCPLRRTRRISPVWFGLHSAQ